MPTSGIVVGVPTRYRGILRTELAPILSNVGVFQVCKDLELPMKDAYSAFLRDLIEKTGASRGPVA